MDDSGRDEAIEIRLVREESGRASHFEWRLGNNRIEAEVQETFRVGERDTLIELRGIRVVMTEELMQRLRSGKITTRNLDGQRRSVFKGARRARADLRKVFKRIGQTGFGHVKDELERQQSKTEAA